MASIQNYLNQIKNAIYGKDVRQAIHDGIQQCYYDGKAGSTDLEARQRLDSAEPQIASLGSRMSTAETNINVLDSRVDQIVAPSGEAPSAAEVTDARVGADGIIYESLGDANRSQFENLNEAIEFSFTEASGYFNNDGSISNATASAEKYTSRMRVVAGDRIKITVNAANYTTQWACYCCWAKDGSFLGRTVFKNATGKLYSEIITVPTGAYEIAFSYRTYESYGNYSVAIFCVTPLYNKIVTSEDFFDDFDFIASPLHDSFSIGSLDNSYGAEAVNANYVRNDKYIFMPKGAKIVFSPLPSQANWTYYLFPYDENLNLLSTKKVSDWVEKISKEYDVADGVTYVRVTCRYTNSAAMSASDPTLFSDAVAFYTTAGESELSEMLRHTKVNRNENILEAKYGALPLTADVELGSYNTSGEKTSSSTRLRAKNLLSFPFDITINCDSSYSFAVLRKNGSSYIDSGLVTTFTISANTEFLFFGRKSPEESITDIYEFATHFYLGNYAKSKIEYLDSKIGRLSNLYVPSEVYGMAHRGMCYEAPQNSAPAFILAKKYGFEWVEADLRWTYDDIPVLLHDSSINYVARNLDGTIIDDVVYVDQHTYSDLSNNYLYNVIDGAPHSEYNSNKLLKLEDALALWKRLGLKVFLEIKSAPKATPTNLAVVAEMVKKYGFEDSIVFESYAYLRFGYIKPYLERPRFAMLCDTVGTEEWTSAQEHILDYKSQGCEMYLALHYSALSSTSINWAIANEIPIATFTLDTEEGILDVDPYVTFIMSNYYNATDVIREHLYSTIPTA